jgi:glucan phosphoethanolaminetransferase (alkaline phosphatase superfamily)
MINNVINKFQKISEFNKISLITGILILYDIFIIKSPTKFFKDIIGGRYIANYLLSIIALIFFILIINLLFKGKIFSKILASILLIIPLGIQTAHYAFYNMPISAYGIRFFFSQPLLTIQLGFENINYFKIIAFILFCTALIFIFLQSNKKTKYTNLFFFIYLPLYVTIIILCGMNWYLILDFQHSVTSAYASIPETARSLYFKKLKKDKPEISLNPTNKIIPNILWIIGESAAKSHMSLYGYTRKTTPKLDNLKDKGDLIPFQNVVSIGPHTLISVPYMLVGKQNIDPQGTIYSSPNIFEYAKARGYDTAFISSQDLRWKNFDQLSGKNIVDFYRAGTDFNSNVSVAKGADDLVVLNSSIIPHLDQMRTPFLMVTQMDGSHYPYNIHSEKQYKEFFPETSPNGTNAYDNTIVYSDIYLSKLIEAARKKDPDIWIFYTTDHGQTVPLAKEIVVKNKKHSNNINSQNEDHDKDERKSIFTTWREKIVRIFEEKDSNDDESKITFNQGYDHDIIHNAFFILPPSNQKENILAKQNKPVAQSDIFATILNLMDINHPVSHIDGLSLLKPIPENRLRISTGFVVTNDNIPEAQITLPDKSSYFIDFSRKSVSFSKDKKVFKFEDAPKEIQALFENKKDQEKDTIKSASL